MHASYRPATTSCSRSPRTLHEAFSASFDTAPSVTLGSTALAGSTALGSTSRTSTFSTTYGFGTASARLNNLVYPSHLKHGLTNNTVIELGLPPDAYDPPKSLPDFAPSRQLPEYALRFATLPGRAFGPTVSRDAPPLPDGTATHWVQPKDLQSPLEATEPPEITAIALPRGAAPPDRMHQQEGALMTPAERREALVFQKCHERAAQTLRKASHDACRLTLMMQRQHPNGVLGVEGYSADSVVYQRASGARTAKESSRAAHAEARLAYLQERRKTPLPYAMLAHHSTHFDSPLFQRKGRVSGCATGHASSQHYELRPSSTATANTAFRSNQELNLGERPATRAQKLLDMSAGGRRHDIISGIRLPVQPSHVADAVHDRRAHPSNMAMPARMGTAPTLIGPIPDSHKTEWKPPSPKKGRGTTSYMM
jgi:hypothetical protein